MLGVSALPRNSPKNDSWVPHWLRIQFLVLLFSLSSESKVVKCDKQPEHSIVIR